MVRHTICMECMWERELGTRDDETSRVLFVRRRGALSAGVNWRARAVLVGLNRMDDE